MKRICLPLFLFKTLVSCAFFPQPYLKWKYALKGKGGVGSRSILRHNAVTPSKYGAALFVTTSDGSLHIITEDTVSVHEVDPKQATYTECQSAVSLYEEGDNFFAIYAVVDVPTTSDERVDQPDDTSLQPVEIKSRILKVSFDGFRVWSLTVRGRVSGTPVVGNDGDKIYVTSNIVVEGDEGTSSSQGRLFVITDNNGMPFVTANKRMFNQAPFGPLGVKTVEMDNVKRDIVYFADSWGDGFERKGNVYFVTPTQYFDLNNGRGGEAYDLKVYSFWGKSSIVKPMVSDDLQVWTGGTGSTLAGWPALVNNLGAGLDEELPQSPLWEVVLNPNSRNSSQPISNSPISSSDNNYLFVNGISNELACLDAQTGEQIWIDIQGEGGYTSEPKFSMIGGTARVYTIEAATGKVRSHDALSGTRYWEFDCTDLTGEATCQNRVEAEFSISPNGDELFYGDVSGNIVALQVAGPIITETPSASPIAPTIPPTMTPTADPTYKRSTSSPTEFLTFVPTQGKRSPVKTSSPTAEVVVKTTSPTGAVFTRPPFSSVDITDTKASSSSSDDKKPLIIAIIVVISCLACLAPLIIVGWNKKRLRKTDKRNMQLEQAETDRRWIQQQKAFEESCRQEEQVMLAEIRGDSSKPKAPPTVTPQRRKKKKSSTPWTPETLASIAEVDDEMSIGTSESQNADERTPVELYLDVPANVDYRMAATPPHSEAYGEKADKAENNLILGEITHQDNVHYHMAENAASPVSDSPVSMQIVAGSSYVHPLTPVDSFGEAESQESDSQLYIEDDLLELSFADKPKESVATSLLESTYNDVNVEQRSDSFDPFAPAGAKSLLLPIKDLEGIESEPGRIMPRLSTSLDDEDDQLVNMTVENCLLAAGERKSKDEGEIQASQLDDPIGVPAAKFAFVGAPGSFDVDNPLNQPQSSTPDAFTPAQMSAFTTPLADQEDRSGRDPATGNLEAQSDASGSGCDSITKDFNYVQCASWTGHQDHATTTSCSLYSPCSNSSVDTAGRVTPPVPTTPPPQTRWLQPPPPPPPPPPTP